MFYLDSRWQIYRKKKNSKVTIRNQNGLHLTVICQVSDFYTHNNRYEQFYGIPKDKQNIRINDKVLCAGFGVCVLCLSCLCKQ